MGRGKYGKGIANIAKAITVFRGTLIVAMKYTGFDVN